MHEQVSVVCFVCNTEDDSHDNGALCWQVTVSPFRIGAQEVSNERFKQFVEATGYVTEAEKFGFSFVVEQFISEQISEGIDSAVVSAKQQAREL